MAVKFFIVTENELITTYKDICAFFESKNPYFCN